MTAESNDHMLDPSFVWDEKYFAQLNALADKDELTEDLRWPPLKGAIKYMLNQTFAQWPTNSAPILHPAASLLPPQALLPEDASTSVTFINGSPHENESDSITGKDSFSSNGSLQDEASSSTSPNTATAALALSSRFQREEEGNNSIRDADLQAFFPSKSRAPAKWGGSWGKRLESKQAVEEERRTIFSMLEDFEGQPPFTIQRLSELVLRPTEHHHTLPKYTSALKRLLSVTATRDAFPAFGSEEEESVMGSALRGEVVNGNGMATDPRFRNRTGTSVPGSPSTAPLFSPIPFLMKSGDEGMPGKAGLDGMAIEDGDVPGMELGGADRTSESAMEMAKLSGAGGGSGSISGRSFIESNDSISETEKPVPLIRPAGEATPVLSDVHLQNSHVTDAGNGPSSNVPLGVPTGRVDELDQLGQKHGQLPPVESGSLGGGAKALSSTTTSTTSEEQEDVDAVAEEDSERAIKRVRSERDLPSLEEEGS